jgi:hypothetical protein
MSKLIRPLTGETGSMIAIAVGAMVAGLVEWTILIQVVSYLLG